MHRLPLADELPFQFLPPKVSRFWVRATRGFRRRMLRKEHKVERIDVEGIEHLHPLLDRGDGVLLAPTTRIAPMGWSCSTWPIGSAGRCARWPCTSSSRGTPACGGGCFRVLGLFPVDREGSDLAAVKAAVQILSLGEHPLLVFPEGEVYHLTDRLTPLREGVAFLAASAARKRWKARPSGSCR